MPSRLFVHLVAAFALSACAANQTWNDASPEQRKAMFEARWNAQIGRYMDLEGLDRAIVVSKSEESKGKRTYIVKQLSQCKIALIVRTEDGVVLSWSYVSEQSKCAAYYYATGA